MRCAEAKPRLLGDTRAVSDDRAIDSPYRRCGALCTCANHDCAVNINNQSYNSAAVDLRCNAPLHDVP
ncbi:hypothetical protein J6590_006096 [Homalodisca vitripennis]|nr:hypothetical protein J6590_006096 [Homalodisca vitripennis]